MKRRFCQSDCVLCNGHEFFFVDTDQLNYMQACQETKQNIAFCQEKHPENGQKNFQHQPLPIVFHDVERLAKFINSEKLPVGGRVDFQAWKTVLDFLGANIKVMRRFAAMRAKFLDSLSMFSSWLVFATLFSKRDVLKLPFRAGNKMYLKFLRAHRVNSIIKLSCDPSVLERIPGEVVPMLNPQTLLGGPLVMTGCKVLESTCVKFYLLDTPERDTRNERLQNLLRKNGYVFVRHKFYATFAIAPANSQWQNVQIKYVAATTPTDLLRCSYRAEHKQCCIVDKNTRLATVNAMHAWAFGIHTCDAKRARLLELQNMKLSEGAKTLKTAVSDASLRYNCPMQFPHVSKECVVEQLQRQNLDVVHDVAHLSTKQNLTRCIEQFVDSLEKGKITHGVLPLSTPYHWLFTCQSLLYHNNNVFRCALDDTGIKELQEICKKIIDFRAFQTTFYQPHTVLVHFTALNFDYGKPFYVYAKIFEASEFDTYWRADFTAST